MNGAIRVAEPARRSILDLRERERSVSELVEQIGLSQPGVSKHLRALREAGLVEVRPDAQRRLYRLRPQPLTEIDSWLRPYREFWAVAWMPSKTTSKGLAGLTEPERLYLGRGGPALGVGPNYSARQDLESSNPVKEGST